jgi:hypothetical protein
MVGRKPFASPVPKVAVHCMVDLDTAERRQRIQKMTGYSLPRLVREALLALEATLENPRPSLSQEEVA